MQAPGSIGIPGKCALKIALHGLRPMRYEADESLLPGADESLLPGADMMEYRSFNNDMSFEVMRF